MIAIGDAVLMPDSLRPFGLPLYGLFNLSEFSSLTSVYDAIMKGLPAKDSGVQAMKQRHGGRWNVVFCDGHIEGLKPSDLFNITNPAVMQRWNIDHQPHKPTAIPQ
jgi:prepilin-type processing-associated H-X9-DG protein